jgi:hypothetical protein
MMKEVIRDIASGSLPLIGTLAFVAAFVLIVIRVAFMTKTEIKHVENLPLEDEMDALNTSGGNDSQKSSGNGIPIPAL